MTKLTLQAAADACGISKQAFHQDEKRGLIKSCGKNDSGRKLYDIEECKRALVENANPGKQSSGRSQKKSANVSPPSAPPVDDERSVLSDRDLARANVSELLRQKEIANVLAKRRENRERDGELVEVRSIKQAWGEMVSHVRSQILLIPAKLARQVALLTDPRDIQIVIDKEMRVLLTTISEYKPADANE